MNLGSAGGESEATGMVASKIASNLAIRTPKPWFAPKRGKSHDRNAFKRATLVDVGGRLLQGQV